MSQQRGQTYEHERLWMVAAMLGASFLGGAAATVLLGSGVQAQGAPQVVTTTQVNLVDGAGRLRGVLAGSDERGLASIAWYDGAGQVRSLSGIEPDGTPVVQLFGASGRPSLVASVAGEDAMLVVGARGVGQALVGAVQGVPHVTLSDGARNRLQLRLGAGGLPRAVLTDAAGRESIALAVGSDDMPQLGLAAAGRLRALLTVAQNAAVLNLRDPERPRLVLGVAENGRPSVNFLNADGGLLMEIPTRR